ncbi:hypothetical protein RM352_004283 [Enterobacter kobei]|nr:hypothetical protein [Enterobacter kobei]
MKIFSGIVIVFMLTVISSSPAVGNDNPNLETESTSEPVATPAAMTDSKSGENLSDEAKLEKIPSTVKDLFRNIDADKNNHITVSEYEKVTGTLSEQERIKFEKLSHEKNGELSVIDFYSQLPFERHYEKSVEK